MDEPEERIVEAVRSGDIERFGELVDRHKDQVYGILRRLVRDPDLAEDLAQTAFVQAYESLDGFRGDASFATWVTQIAIHLARDSFRRQRRRGSVISLEELLEQRAEAPELVDSRAVYDPFEILAEGELAERLERAMTELPDDYRQVFVLRHLEDMSYEQIESLTGDSVGALKVRNHRARKLLLERLGREESDARLQKGRS